MKKLKLLIFSTLLCAAVASLGACVTTCSDDTGGDNTGGDNTADSTGDGEHSHVWGKWVFVVKPTLDTVGIATRTCTADDGGSETKEDVPTLSDSEVWTKDMEKSTLAGHAKVGKDIYFSEYGEVEVEAEALEHTWGAWVFDKEPTLDTVGIATRTCTADDGGSEAKADVPALSDSEVWTITEYVAATYDKSSKTVYESVYGTVTVEGDALAPPFFNRAYYVGAALDFYTDYGKADTETAENSVGKRITLDGAIGSDGDGGPFIPGATYELELVDRETGEMKITEISVGGTQSYFKAFVDFDTCLIVWPQFEGDLKRIYILVAADDFNAAYDGFGGSVWRIEDDYKFAITYTCGNGTEGTGDGVHNILIEGAACGAVHFGVSFINGGGEPLLGENAYDSDYLYIYDREGARLGAYGLTGDGLAAVDGYEGEYAIAVNDYIEQPDGMIFISGFGTATLETDGTYSGTYVILKDNAYGNLLVVVEALDVSYYLTFNGGGRVTLETATVVVSFELNGHGSITKNKVEAMPGIPLALEEPESDEDVVFMGWYYDAEFENKVEATFIPVAPCTLYAGWEDPVYAGTYTDQYGKKIILDGAGRITYDGAEGTYTLSDGGEYTLSAFVGEGADLVYYEITLDGTSATTDMPSVRIDLDFMGVDVGERINTIITNKNVPITLPGGLEDSTGAYIFDGWYADAELTMPAILPGGKYNPAKNATLYACWIKNLTVHVHYNNSEVNFEESRHVGDGRILTVDEPERRVYGEWIFDGFYTTPDFLPGTEWENGSEICEADGPFDIYAKWIAPVKYYGTFSGKYINGGNHPTAAAVNPLTIDGFGHAAGLGTSDSNKVIGDIEDYDEATGKFKLFVSATSYYLGAFDSKNGVMVVDGKPATSENAVNLSSAFTVMFLGATDVSFAATDGSQWNDAATTLITFTVDGEKITVFIHENRIWGNVSIGNTAGAVSAYEALNTETFTVYDSEGYPLYSCDSGKFVKIGGTGYPNDTSYIVEDISSGSYRWEESPAGVWRVDGSPAYDGAIVSLKITFAVAGTLTFNYECYFKDSVNNGGCYDGLFAAQNTERPEEANSKLLNEYNSAGTLSVTLGAGEYLCICAVWEADGKAYDGDHVYLSEFVFVPA